MSNIIPLSEVESSNIHSIGYDAPSQTLGIRFRSGGTYHYQDVPPELFEQFVQAESKGKFFHSAVKGKYTGVPQPTERDNG